MTEKNIRNKIFKEIKKFYKLRSSKDNSTLGKKRIDYGGRVYDEKELINLVDASLDFWLTAGRYAKEFEKKLADFLNMRYCLLTNSGSSANLLTISALTSSKLKDRRLKPGDEIITTACGFSTTLNPILQNRLVPVFVDIKIGTYNIDVDKIERAVTKKTKAIFVAHTLGNPVEVEKILKIVRKYNLWFCEDNCDALGSKYKNKYTGSFGHISTCSFYPAHHITTGEGGAVLTSDPLLRRIILSLRDWGRDCWCDPGTDNTCGRRFNWQLGDLPKGYDHKYVYSHIGYNLKLTDMQAAIGVAQLKKLPSFIKKRQENFRLLYKGLNPLNKYFILPEPTPKSDPSWFGFPISIRKDAPFSRNKIVKYLEDKNIATRLLFGGNLIRQPAYRGEKYRVAGNLKNSDFVMNRLFWVGVYPGLDKRALKYVIDAFHGFCQQFN